MNLSDGICSLCLLEIEDIEHIFCKCNVFSGVWAFTESLLINLGITELTNLNKISGIFHGCHEFDVTNMILSITRWIIWKGRCSKKYGELLTISSVKFELSNTIYKHIQMLLNSKIKIPSYTKQQLLSVLKSIDSIKNGQCLANSVVV